MPGAVGHGRDGTQRVSPECLPAGLREEEFGFLVAPRKTQGLERGGEGEGKRCSEDEMRIGVGDGGLIDDKLLSPEP